MRERFSILLTTRRWQELLAYVVALLPVGWMIGRVHQATLFNYLDYWDAFRRITHPDGSLHVRGLFTYQNEHPILVPNVVYFLSARFFGGTNRVLGYYSVIVAVGMVLVLRALLPAHWSSVARAWATAALSAAVLCPAGVWNFARGMSGTAWLTADLLALLAILLAARGHTRAALAPAALAMASYGTGFGAPIALALIAVLRREARWRWAAPAALFAVGAAVYASSHHSNGSGTGVTHSPMLFASTFLSLLGMLVDPEGGALSVTIGAAGVLVLVSAFAKAWRRPALADLVPWFAVALFSLCAVALVSLARSETFNGDGVQSRYTSLSALFWIAVAIVSVRTHLATRGVVLQVGALATGLAVFYATSPTLVTNATAASQSQDLVATAARLGIADGFQTQFHSPDDQIVRLKALHAYPFNDRFSLGCGHRVPGDAIDPTAIRPLVVDQHATYGSLDSRTIVGSATYYRGWLRRSLPLQCVLVVDSNGVIVGGGAVGFFRDDVQHAHHSFSSHLGFEAVAPAADADQRLVLGFADGFWSLQ
ncbi:MAG TPA: hypothetical protein VJ831_00220 [Jatrophihabitantaceae bacterium]|nr:hypothetical protein [Jatrophihabitantaceae bacterium]